MGPIGEPPYLVLFCILQDLQMAHIGPAMITIWLIWDSYCVHMGQLPTWTGNQPKWVIWSEPCGLLTDLAWQIILFPYLCRYTGIELYNVHIHTIICLLHSALVNSVTLHSTCCDLVPRSEFRLYSFNLMVAGRHRSKRSINPKFLVIKCYEPSSNASHSK